MDVQPLDEESQILSFLQLILQGCQKADASCQWLVATGCQYNQYTPDSWHTGMREASEEHTNTTNRHVPSDHGSWIFLLCFVHPGLANSVQTAPAYSKNGLQNDKPLHEHQKRSYNHHLPSQQEEHVIHMRQQVRPQRTALNI